VVSKNEVRYAPRQLLKAVAMWMDKHGAAMVESVEDVSESAVKAALEDFMYSLPKAAIAELKPVFKKKINPMSVTAGVMRLASVTAILKKHGVAPKFMGMNSAKVVNDFFDNFFGESVEEDGELAEAPTVAMPVGGYSKPQFESRMRELIRKMGFEKGITNIRSEGTKMIVCFALAPKARDFMATINSLMRMRAKGNVATIDTNFNRIKAPAGTTAIVTLDFSKVQQEEFLDQLTTIVEGDQE
jgi:hypothetical protein